MVKKIKMKVKELEKQLYKSIRTKVKEYNFKVINGSIYFRKGDSFFHILPYVRYKDNAFYVLGDFCFKSMALDDMFWDIFDMSSNKTAPISLRANGAFTIRGIPISKIAIEINMSDENALENALNKLFQNLVNRSNQINDSIDSYIQLHLISPNYYQGNLAELVFLILKKKYKEVLDKVTNYMANGDKGQFCNQGKYINEYIKEYCMKAITSIIRYPCTDIK